MQYHLAVGKRYTAGQYEQLRLQTQYKKARDKAFSLLSRRAYPAAQLRQKLEQDFPEDCVQEVLERVEELGLIDDADYALRCAKDLINIKHYSLQRVRQELRHRGIHDNDIEDAMQEFEDLMSSRRCSSCWKKVCCGIDRGKGKKTSLSGAAAPGV